MSMATLESEVLQEVLDGIDRSRAALEDARRALAEGAPDEGSFERMRRDYDQALARQPRIDAGTASIIARLNRPGVVRSSEGG